VITNNQTASLLSTRSFVLSLLLVSFPLGAARANAQSLDIPVDMQCGAYRGKVFAPPYHTAYNFHYSSGKLSAIRYTKKRPGEEVYSGSISPQGYVRIEGYGAYNGEGHPPWKLEFEGKIAELGETVITGELVYNGFKRQCSISFRDTGEQLYAQLGLLKSGPSPRPVPPPTVLPEPVPTSPSPTPVASNPPPTPSINITITSANAAKANIHIADLQSQIDVLAKVLAEQLELQKTAADDSRPSVDKTIEAVNAQLERLKNEYSAMDKSFGVYLTSIKPNDRDPYLTARKASEIYPKIPYYIPGTNETGEFWVEPSVSDRGELQFGFKFVDTNSSLEKVRETIVMSLPEIEDAQKALFKLQAWSEIAHQQKLRRNYEKRVTCFPVSECPPDGERVDGKASTEMRFNVYEDGSTAGRIQRNKGLFVEGYNVSIDSAMLLQAYLSHVIKEARIEFNSGTQDKNALDDLFH